jgi:purine-nucleoside/S-methyl-5'-thioadenosine phosphorylase / adenosine deaminase
MKTDCVIQPNWPAPANIYAYTTLRHSNISRPPDRYLDCDRLISLLDLPTEPIWLRQIHSNIVLPAIPENRNKEADATFSHEPQQVCIVLTADCLPILLCDQTGSHVAAIHAGWRGLQKNIIANTLQALNVPGYELLAWIGPGISQKHYEVGDEVRTLFINADPQTTHAFIPSPNQRWMADLYTIAKIQLQKQGITKIYGCDFCTYTDDENFFSCRRDGKGKFGNMASLIWREK